MFWRIINYASA